MESRELLSLEPITLSDPSFWGVTGSGTSEMPFGTFGGGSGPCMSADGQRIVFQSSAPNLVPNDNNGAQDVFVYDRGAAQVNLVSVNPEGIASSDLGGYNPQITPDGRYVIFWSSSNRLFRRDLLTGSTALVSVNLAGTGDVKVSDASISDDGRYIAFSTNWSGLVPEPTPENVSQIYLRDMVAGTTSLVSQTSGTAGNHSSESPIISGNGNSIVFDSDADNLVANDDNVSGDIFAWNRAMGSISLVTIDKDSIFSQNGQSSYSRQCVTADGRYVVFESGANNLVAQGSGGHTNAYLRDMINGKTHLLSIDYSGVVGTEGYSVTITPNGQFAAFVSRSDNVACDRDDHNGLADVYLVTITGAGSGLSTTNRLVSVNAAGDNGGDGNSSVGMHVWDISPGFPQVTPDGRYVAFCSEAGNLASGVIDANQGQSDNIDRRDVFVRDMQQSQTKVVSVTAAGTSTGDRGSYTALISDDGRYVAFESDAANLVSEDGNRKCDVFTRDLAAGIIEVVSACSPLLPEVLLAGVDTELNDITPDGRYVVFTAATDRLTPEVPGVSGFYPQAYLRDRVTGTTRIISTRPDGSAGSNTVYWSRISADGRFALIHTTDNNLDPTVVGTNGGDYLRDLVTGQVTMISRNTTTGAPANRFHGYLANFAFAMSPDDRYVAFVSTASNLAGGVTAMDGQANLYLYDRVAGTLQMVSASAAGTAEGNGDTPVDGYYPVFSADSRKLAFTSWSSDLIDGVTDTNNTADVFVYDLTSGQKQLVSANSAGNACNNDWNMLYGAGGPSISADGRYVAFAARATDLVPQATDGRVQVYRRDLELGTTQLVSVNLAGTAGATGGNSYNPTISADGAKVLFQSEATGLTSLGNSGSWQLYVRDLTAGSTQMVTVNATGTAGGNDDSGAMMTYNNARMAFSPNGCFVAFNSLATDLVPGYVRGTGNTSWDLYLRDLSTGTTVLASYNASGTAGGNRKSSGGNRGTSLVTDDGTLVFESNAGDLVAGKRRLSSGYDYAADVYAFQYLGAASIAGTVFNDANGNGTKDGSELGMQYWTLFLDGNANGSLDPAETSVVSDATGNYRFTNLAAGNYRVAVVPQVGYVQTSPLSPGVWNVTLTTATDVQTNKDFAQQVEHPDLAVTAVSAPASSRLAGVLGGVTWTVQNNGTTLTGAWQDSVYLSQTPALGSGAILLATVPHLGGLAAGASYNAGATVTLPLVAPGDYFLVVQTDSRASVLHEVNRADNIRAAATATALDVPTLTLGVPYSLDSFTAAGQEFYYKLIVPSDSAGMTVKLDSSAAEGGTSLYLRRGALATAWDFDLRAAKSQPDQAIVNPTTPEGTYYVLARSEWGATTTAGFTLRADLANGLTLVAHDPVRAREDGPVTLRIDGINMSPATTVSLVRGTTVLVPAAIDYRDSTLLYATFNLTSDALNSTRGVYDVRLQDGTQTTVLPESFEIGWWWRQFPPQFVALLETPPVIRYERETVVIVNYANQYDCDIVAPILVISAENGLFRQPDNPNVLSPTVQVLATSSDGPAGILRPGQGGKIVLRLLSTTAVPHGVVSVEANTVLDNYPMDWAAQKAAMRPATIATDAWDAIWENLMPMVGTTTTSYDQRLSQAASYLGRLGCTSNNVGQLFSFLVSQADAAFPGATLSDSVDATMETPGLGLSMERSFPSSISGRYWLGMFGRGWSSGWESSLAVDTDGNVTIDSGGATRFFAVQRDGTYQGSRGEYGTLSASGDIFTLTETDGTKAVFRAGDHKLEYLYDTNGNRITLGYHTDGRLTSITHSCGVGLALYYNEQGFVSMVQDSAGRITQYFYETDGQHLTRVVSPQGTVRYQYVTGQGAAREHALAQVTDPTGVNSYFSYDAQGRLIGTQLEGGAEAITLAYPGDGQVVFTDAVGAQTITWFNASGQPEQVSDPNGQVSNFAYDVNGNLVETVNPRGGEYQYAYDSRGNCTSAVNPLGQTVRMVYGSLDRLAESTDARGNTTRYDYDLQGNLRTITYPHGGQESMGYDPLGNLTETINRRGHVTGYTRDLRGRTIRTDFADGTFQTFIYDGFDNLVAAADAAGTIVLQYANPADNRLTQIDYPGGRHLAFSYDAAGRRIQSVDQDGFTLKYIYDAAGRLDRLTDAATVPNLIVQYHYDVAARLVQKDLGNGTFTSYEYDLADQLLSIKNFRVETPTPVLNSQIDYTYDALGRPTSMTDATGITSYAYDEIGQLTHVALPGGRTIDYQYDAAGNRTQTIDSQEGTTVYTVDAENQITTATSPGGTTTYIYDADGNLHTATDAAGATTYTFNDLNQLTGINGPGDASSYEYNPLGFRVAATQGGSRFEYLVDPAGLGNVVSEYNVTAGSLLARYVHGLGLVSRIGLDGAAYYDFDAVGNTVGMTGAARTYVKTYRYLPFGETTGSGTLPNPFQFSGQFGVMQDDSGLLFMRARYYQPDSGQFLSIDPLGLGGGDLNLRQYVGNAPTVLVDPAGLTGTVAIPGGPMPAGPAPAGWWGEYPNGEAVWVKVPSAENDMYGEPSYKQRQHFIEQAFERRRLKDMCERGEAKIRERQAALQAEKQAARIKKLLDAAKTAGKTAGKFGRIGLRFAGAIGTAVTVAEAAPYAIAVAQHPPKFHPENLGKFGKKLLENLISGDPNDLVGPGGFGSQQYVAPVGDWLYTIDFENDPKIANAPAQEVRITHQLDADLDWSSFALDSFGFGSATVMVPAGLQQFQTQVDYHNADGSPLRVDVTLAFSQETGQFSVTLLSVDPVTGTFPDDPFAGLLPPDDATNRGKGFVRYTIQPKATLVTGTAIDQQASIVFDANAPIATNVFHNTIDAGAPTSTVAALPPFTNTRSFSVSWSGSDDADGPAGSGIAAFDVFVSIDSGAFQAWLTGTAQVSTTYAGAFGHTYAFYSVATDNVGHRQPTPTAAQASTTLLPCDTVGVYVPDNSAFYLNDEQNGGDAEHVFVYGVAGIGWMELVGDWNGDGQDTPGMYDPATATFYLTDRLEGGDATYTFQFGIAGQEWKPLVGDWNADGKDTIAVYEPATSLFFFKNTLAGGDADEAVQFGVGSLGWIPITGDWDGLPGDGFGFYEPAISAFWLKNARTPGPAEECFQFGMGSLGWTVLAGNWDGAPGDGVGFYVPATAQFFLKNEHAPGPAEISFTYGIGGAGWRPLTGCWTATVSAAPPASAVASAAAWECGDLSPVSPAAEVKSGDKSPHSIDSAAVDRLDLAALAAQQLQPTVDNEGLDLLFGTIDGRWGRKGARRI